ncbi:MAG: hypothetical protein QXL59_08380 [Candidatus Jordarchaeales archaeon]
MKPLEAFKTPRNEKLNSPPRLPESPPSKRASPVNIVILKISFPIILPIEKTENIIGTPELRDNCIMVPSGTSLNSSEAASSPKIKIYIPFTQLKSAEIFFVSYIGVAENLLFIWLAKSFNALSQYVSFTFENATTMFTVTIDL